MQYQIKLEQVGSSYQQLVIKNAAQRHEESLDMR